MACTQSRRCVVSFLVELDIEGVTPKQGEAVEAPCRARDAWPIGYTRRRMKDRILRKPKYVEPALWVPDAVEGRYLISDQADWEQRFWDLAPEFRRELAESFRILDEFVPQGFKFRATRVGDEIRQTKELTAHELADCAAASQINRVHALRRAA